MRTRALHLADDRRRGRLGQPPHPLDLGEHDGELVRPLARRITPPRQVEHANKRTTGV
jgi:hypothetical protein